MNTRSVHPLHSVRFTGSSQADTRLYNSDQLTLVKLPLGQRYVVVRGSSSTSASATTTSAAGGSTCQPTQTLTQTVHDCYVRCRFYAWEVCCAEKVTLPNCSPHFHPCCETSWSLNSYILRVPYLQPAGSQIPDYAPPSNWS